MKRRKKVSIMLITALLSTLMMSLPVQASVNQFDSVKDLENSLDSHVIGMPMSERYPIYWGPNYEVSSKEGYDTVVKENDKSYKIRVRNVRLEQAGHGPLELLKEDPICTLSPGQTYTTTRTQSVSTQRKISVDAGINIKFKTIAAIDRHIGYSESKTITHTVQIGWKYAFPSEYINQYNSITWYAGFHHDKYLATIDKVPYERKEKNFRVIDYRIIEDGGEYYASTLEYTLENGDVRTLRIYPDERLEDHFEVINGQYYDRIVTYECDYNNRETYTATILRPIPGEYIIGRP
ncbi:hypothetical protein [Wukongibacter sp. M2B1]|uniref:hypothetical protein n=1 Tax=Wukongibacter sp. M2B1 TaxID=3088895 RepID=UPI003D7A915E